MTCVPDFGDDVGCQSRNSPWPPIGRSVGRSIRLLARADYPRAIDSGAIACIAQILPDQQLLHTRTHCDATRLATYARGGTSDHVNPSSFQRTAFFSRLAHYGKDGYVTVSGTKSGARMNERSRGKKDLTCVRIR